MENTEGREEQFHEKQFSLSCLRDLRVLRGEQFEPLFTRQWYERVESPMASELILIIEDNEKNRKLCRDVLQVKGYRTIESETAEDGLKLAAEQCPALILMDIQLPGMDGITAMKQLKADATTKDIPIIAITASAMTNNRTAMLDQGFDGYQTKPISLKEFLGEVERVLRKA